MARGRARRSPPQAPPKNSQRPRRLTSSQVGGEALFPRWFAAYLVSFILRNNAVLVLPNYRLIPEHNGFDILSDISGFWTWFEAELPSYVASVCPDVALDTGHVLVAGDSAGGHMAAHSAMMTAKGRVTAMLLTYPMTSWLRRKVASTFMGSPAPGPERIGEYLAKIVPGETVSSFTPTYRMDLSYALSAYGRWREFFGTTHGLLPIEAIEHATHFPPTYIIHGRQDTAVSVEDTLAFKEKVGRVLGKEVGDSVRVELQDGDHGFEVELMEHDTPWLREGLKWVEEQWLA